VLGVFFQKLCGNPYLPNRTQDLFSSVVVIVVHVQTCCLALIHHKLIQIMGMASKRWKSNCDKRRKYNSIWEKTFLCLEKISNGSEDAYRKLHHSTTIISVFF